MTAVFERREVATTPTYTGELAIGDDVADFTRDFSAAVNATLAAENVTADVQIVDGIDTSVTTYNTVSGKIDIQISLPLVLLASEENRLAFLGFNVLHEVGHAKRFKHQRPTKVMPKEEAYFSNITEDTAINYDNARKTRYITNITKTSYDDYLYPLDKRARIAQLPRHQQFMDSMLVLAMTTGIHSLRDPIEIGEYIEEAGLVGLNDAVLSALAKIVHFGQSGKNYNLLGQLREYGAEYTDYNRVYAYIKALYDELFEEDLRDHKQQTPQNGQGEGGGQTGPQQNKQAEGDQIENPFDYSKSGGCKHGEHSSEEKLGEESSTNDNQPGSPGDIGEAIKEVAKKIGGEIISSINDAKNAKQDQKQQSQLSPEQIAQLKRELGLSDNDFDGFMRLSTLYSAEINAIADMIRMLRRDRQNEFLAPSREVAARGHRVHIGKLLGYLAGGSNNPYPDIWKSSEKKENIEHEFDGADFIFMCDVSRSMAGDKAIQATASAVTLSQGVQLAGLEVYADEPPIRIQIQAFGAGDEILCPLNDMPDNASLGKMYKSLAHPNSNSTIVSGALEKVEPAGRRLTLVVILSDGQFHDLSAAQKQATRLEQEGATLLQCVFGNAEVGSLSENSKRINIANAKDLPNFLLGIMPELIDVLRSSSHA